MGARSGVTTIQPGASFSFVDHEFAYAGGYALVPAASVARDASFDFLDHEFAYAGGYALVPATSVARDASFDFLDHELAYAGGYILRPASPSELTIADASDPVQVTSLEALEA
ncbi:MAG: hypothetical protein ACP5JJ_19805, partial [Anaerolineae bacterium]